MELLLPVQRRLIAAALLRQHVQQHRVVGGLQKLEALDQQRQIVPVDGPKVLQAKLLKHDRGPQDALGRFFGAAHNLDGRLAAEALNQPRGRLVQMLVVLVGHDPVEVPRNRAHVAVDGPLVVVEHHDQPLGLLGNVVHRLEGNAVGKRSVAGHGDHMLCAAGQVARHGHAQRRGKRGAGMSRAEAVVLALGAQHKAVQPARLADGVKPLAPTGKNLVHVGLVAHVEHDLVFRSIKNRMQRQRQFHNAQVGSQVSAGLRQRLNQELANLFRQLRHLRFVQALHIGGRLDGLQQCSHGLPSPGRVPGFLIVPGIQGEKLPRRPENARWSGFPGTAQASL